MSEGTAALSIIAFILTCMAAWATHVIVCIKTASWLFLLAVSALSFSFGAKVARGADGHTHHGAVGRFYQSWMMPDAPHVSCCHDEDCGPAQSRFQNGHWEARWTDDEPWVVIPAGKVEQDRDTPDGRSHMCGRKSGGAVMVFCFVRGNAA